MNEGTARGQVGDEGTFDDHGAVLTIVNEGGRAARRQWLWRLVRQPSRAVGSRLLNSAKRRNPRPQPRAPVDPQMMGDLRRTLGRKVEGLSALIDRNAIRWIRT